MIISTNSFSKKSFTETSNFVDKSITETSGLSRKKFTKSEIQWGGANTSSSMFGTGLFGTGVFGGFEHFLLRTKPSISH